MPELTLSNEQVIALVQQLPTNQQTIIFEFLVRQQWPAWAELNQYGINQIRALAEERGLDWDQIPAQDREDWIDQLVHES